jgi:hypothetical protein
MFPNAAMALLSLFVINLGIAFGAGIYEHRIVTPRWTGGGGGSPHWNAEAARRDDTGLRFWVYVTTGPLTLLTLANLAIAWTTSGPARAWWLAAGLLVLADRLFTFGYFIPTMVGLMKAPDSPVAVAAATRWIRLNYLRHALVFAGWIAALEALVLRSQAGG